MRVNCARGKKAEDRLQTSDEHFRKFFLRVLSDFVSKYNTRSNGVVSKEEIALAK